MFEYVGSPDIWTDIKLSLESPDGFATTTYQTLDTLKDMFLSNLIVEYSFIRLSAPNILPSPDQAQLCDDSEDRTQPNDTIFFLLVSIGGGCGGGWRGIG